MRPLSQYIPKCLLPYGDTPLIVRHLQRLESLGVERITIVLEPMYGVAIETAMLRGYKGRMWVKFLYQDHQQGRGPGHALLLCRDYVRVPLLVYLPDEWRVRERFSDSIINEHDRYFDGMTPRFDSAIAVARYGAEALTQIGNVLFNESSLITNYLNKPEQDQIVSEWGTSGGWAFFNHALLFDQLDRFATDVQYRGVDLHMAVIMQSIVDQGARVFAYQESDSPHIHFTNVAALWREGPDAQ